MLPTPPQSPLISNHEARTLLSNLQTNLRLNSAPEPPETRDLTNQAIWEVSTAKPGNGIEQILDSNPKTYWQSDGPQPHTITAQFTSKVKISSIGLFLDFADDESYTPAVVSVRAGSNAHDLQYVRRSRRIKSPKGWVDIPLGEYVDSSDECSEEESEPEQEDETPEDVAARLLRRTERNDRRAERTKLREEKVEAAWNRAEEGVNGKLESMRDRSITRAHTIQIVIHCNHQNGRDSHVRMVRVIGPREQIATSYGRFTSREFQVYQTIR